MHTGTVFLERILSKRHLLLYDKIVHIHEREVFELAEPAELIAVPLKAPGSRMEFVVPPQETVEPIRPLLRGDGSARQPLP